ncbi:MAG: hypothetical protein M3R27_04270 [Bacteroidota bacterium]|nr:hypothetical protein [Bacteroidota bacterium]
MKKFILLLFLIFPFLFCEAQSFRLTQQKATRVKAAYKEKWEGLKTDLQKKQLKENFEMYLRIFKQEEITEVWLRSKGDKEYKLFKSYEICSSSGTLGPKRKQGDGQVPEGFYHIAVFNPYSSYHLSLGVSYPNSSDKIIIGKGNAGGDIMIHGSCVTIGCVPLTDSYIKEVYLLAVEARKNGQNTIPVHIFPAKLDDKGFKKLEDEFDGNKKLIDFWKSLKPAYEQFEKYKQVPSFVIDKSGKYIVTEK